MASIERFEDIQAWQEARKLVKDIYRLTTDEKVRKYWGLCDQIRRAAVSVMSNVAEGFERDSDNEFKRFLYISKGSAGEVRSLFYVLKDLNHISQNTYNNLNSRVLEISKLISGFIKYLAK